MSDDHWTDVDQYVEDLLLPSDPALEAALSSSAAAGLPSIHVSPAQGKFLHLLARSVRARSILEIGTLGGYSTIWLARALPDAGRLLSLEVSPRHAEVARQNLERAGLSDRAQVRLGPALETLPRLAEEGRGPFDLTFIDADKPTTAEYFDWAVRLSHAGSVVVVDNVVRKGTVAREEGADASSQGIRRFLARLSGDARVSATVVQTVGRKGYDGFALAFVTGGP
ncbi:MAG: O-methyltransferase [Thermoplasmata archaeon]|jgi:predicted O-methyltransferase YrrM